jgi:hypothetical protein
LKAVRIINSQATRCRSANGHSAKGNEIPFKACHQDSKENHSKEEQKVVLHACYVFQETMILNAFVLA